MFLLIFIFNILSAQEVQLEFNDWNYDTKIEIDSLNIRNIGLGIDYTIINPTEFNLSKIINEHNTEFEYKYDVKTTYKNNILKVSSNTEISQIKIIDHIGKRIFETNNNKKSIEINIDLFKNISIILITIDNHSVVQKIYAKENELFLSNYVLLKDKNEWIFTPYKKNYRDTTYTFQNYQLKDTLDIDLKRERYLITIKFKFKDINYYQNYSYLDRFYNKLIVDDTLELIDDSVSFSFEIFNEKSYQQYIDYTCLSEKIIDTDSGFTTKNNGQHFNIIFTDNIIDKIKYFYGKYKSTGGCIYEYFDISMHNKLELIDGEFYLNKNDFNFFRYYYYNYSQDVSSMFSYYSKYYKKKSDLESNVDATLTIKKLD